MKNQYKYLPTYTYIAYAHKEGMFNGRETSEISSVTKKKFNAATQPGEKLSTFLAYRIRVSIYWHDWMVIRGDTMFTKRTYAIRVFYMVFYFLFHFFMKRDFFPGMGVMVKYTYLWTKLTFISLLGKLKILYVVWVFLIFLLYSIHE